MATGLDNETAAALLRQGIDPDRLASIQPKSLPPNAAGIPGLLTREARELRDTNTSGFVLDSKKPGVNPMLADAMFLAPDAKESTIAHEAEHLMARRQLGAASKMNTKFDELFGQGGKEARAQFVNNAVAAAPYLTEKYGLESGYFDPRMIKFQGSLAPNLLYEQLAELASLEQTHGVDLTKDPVLRKTLFKDKDIRETYNAMTGLRQTRLDPRDLPPYTRQPEQGESVGAVQKLKQLMGFANGGRIDHAGNRKDI